MDPDGTGEQAPPRRRGILCAEVCDATCRMLSEQGRTGEAAPRLRPEWTRTVCLESARVVERHPGAEETARACHDCARACSAFMAVLD
ncbi:hypothetical protein SZN_33586 [Streptomyces zinciresistens K42]|uniref:Ferredoxin n=1 Tax=Streptomyces zinciresistens K42 TaxID=700597 RepID=G2GMG5_9ACTN|nr:hypothetical protein SZN_33586 [Streptomyces zinciresistens K42]